MYTFKVAKTHCGLILKYVINIIKPSVHDTSD